MQRSATGGYKLFIRWRRIRSVACAKKTLLQRRPSRLKRGEEAPMLGGFWMQNVSKTTRQSIDGGGVQDSSEVAGTAKLLRRRRAPVKMIVGCLAMMATALSVYAQEAWQQKVKEELPLMGHRNWIVIVDSAYPLDRKSVV